jgi:hypothetical protein
MSKSRWKAKARQASWALGVSVSVLVACPAFAADEVAITPSNRVFQTQGRGIVTLRFDVENRSGQTRDFIEQISLPAGWDLVSNLAPFPLAANARETRLIHVSVPRSATAGNFPVRYSVNARDNGSINGTETVNVSVDTVSSSELVMIATPPSLLGGNDYEATFQLRNTGNRAITYRLRVDDEDGYVKTVTPTTVTLQPSESSDIQVKGIIPPDITETTTHKFTLIAKGGGKVLEQDASIALISRTPKGLGKYHTLSGNLRLSYSGAGKSGGGQWQAEYQAQGALDKDGEHNVAVRLRNGQSSNTSHNDLQSEYQGRYWNDEWEVDAGHESFYAGRLSGNSVSGIGAEVTYHPKDKKGNKPLEARVFSGKSRPGIDTQEKATGAAVNYRFDELRTEIGASVLNHEKQGKPKQTITSANIGWTGSNLSVRAETAKDDDASAKAVDVTANWENIGANLNHVQGDTKFDGANADSKQTYGGITWRIDDDTTANLTANKTRDNLANDASREIRDSRSQEVKLTRKFGEERNIEISAGYRTRKEQDLRPNPTVNNTVKSAVLEYRHTVDELDWTAQWEQGKRDDKIKSSGAGSRQQLALNWRPDKQKSAGITWSRNNSLDSNTQNTAYGINGRYRINRKQDIDGYWQRSSSQDGTKSDSLSISYRHELKNRHQLQLNTSHTRTNAATSTKDNYWRVEYVMPLDIPLRKRNDVGTLGGFAFYADTDEPAKDMVLNLDGQYAVTDAEGKYFYPDILAKDYQLQVDPSRTDGVSYMLGEEGGVRTVKVDPGKLNRLDLPLQPGASVNGYVRTYAVNKAAAAGKTGDVNAGLQVGDGLGGILLELQPLGDGAENRQAYKRLTDGDGSFSFLGIPPGQYQLVVVDTDKMPKHIRLEQTQFQLDLMAGEPQEIDIRAVPTEQTIQKVGPAGGLSVSG